MSLMLLFISHLAAAALGAVGTYLLINKYAKAVDVDGHPAIEFIHEEVHHMEPTPRSPRWSAVLTLIVATAMIVIGFQVYVANDQKADRDKADREYADCLAAFAGDLVDTIEVRTDASTKVSEANSERANAVDQVIRVVLKARQDPPKATVEDFDEALKRASAARRALDRAQVEADKIRSDNKYVAPEVVCER